MAHTMPPAVPLGMACGPWRVAWHVACGTAYGECRTTMGQLGADTVLAYMVMAYNGYGL